MTARPASGRTVAFSAGLSRIHCHGEPAEAASPGGQGGGTAGKAGDRAMSQAIVDPGELRRFAQQLRGFTTDVQARMAQLKGQLNNLGQTWRDQENQKFSEEFEQTMVVLARFCEVSEQQVPFLLRKAQRIEEYLQQR